MNMMKATKDVHNSKLLDDICTYKKYLKIKGN